MADPVRDRPGPDYARLIEPDRVRGSLYTDPRAFADELARIWYRTWVYVGHWPASRSCWSTGTSRCLRWHS